MKKLFIILPLVFLLCFTFGCQQGEEVAEEPVVVVEADINALKNMLDEWVELYNAGDFEKLVSCYYAEDAVGMVANQPILEGREAILANYKKASEEYDQQCDSSIAKDVRVSGNMAMVRVVMLLVIPVICIPTSQRHRWFIRSDLQRLRSTTARMYRQ